MKPSIFALAAVLAACLAGAATAADSGADSTRASHAGRSSSLGLGVPTVENHFLRDQLGAPTTGYLTVNLNLTSMPWYEPPTRFEAITYGAGTAATLGMFMGAIGNTLGVFDERTTWLITGSLAAAGAVYGGTHYEPAPAFRLRLSHDGQQ